MSLPVVAVTGASGFVGQRLAPLLAAGGWRVRLLLRRDPVREQWRGMDPQIVAGDLGDSGALRQLVSGVDAVVHVAGLIKAARQRQYDAVNFAGSTRLAEAVAAHAPQAHFLHLSTMAAREPQLSGYAASKRAGEDAVLKLLGSRVTVLRPPAVYGPGDRETLVFFQIARNRLVPLLGTRHARAAMIHVDDLCSLMVALLHETPAGRVLSASDARADGYSWQEVFATAARAMGNARPLLFHAPAVLLHGVALAGDVARLFGTANMLTTEKLRELRHPDWSVPAEQRAQPARWTPAYSLPEGFGNAVAWYRRAGWL
ncbi:MAG: NAD-dependent epimerase/dehydratase family protein [Pseudomonadota bacterium]|nr:NAD-dependent epimerase/dehydratase family protein [Pseudomonadota bacterium]